MKAFQGLFPKLFFLFQSARFLMAFFVLFFMLIVPWYITHEMFDYVKDPERRLKLTLQWGTALEVFLLLFVAPYRQAVYEILVVYWGVFKVFFIVR